MSSDWSFEMDAHWSGRPRNSSQAPGAGRIRAAAIASATSEQLPSHNGSINITRYGGIKQ
jgi:hypothetical protein